MDQPAVAKELVAACVSRTAPRYDRAAVVQRDLARRLVASIERVTSRRVWNQVLELGCGTGLLTALLLERFAIRQLTLNDLVADFSAVAERAGGTPRLAPSWRSGQVTWRQSPFRCDKTWWCAAPCCSGPQIRTRCSTR